MAGNENVSRDTRTPPAQRAHQRLVPQQFMQRFTLRRCQLHLSLPNFLVTSDRAVAVRRWCTTPTAINNSVGHPAGLP